MQTSSIHSKNSITSSAPVLPPQFEEKDQQEAEKQAIIKELEAKGYYDIEPIIKGSYAIYNPRPGLRGDGYVYHTRARHPQPGRPFEKNQPIELEIMVHRDAKDGPFPTNFYIHYVHRLGGW